MTIIFLYNLTIEHWIKVIFQCFFEILGYAYLIKAGNHQKEGIKSPFLLKLMGIINIIVLTSFQFFPSIHIDPNEFTNFEYFIFKNYKFFHKTFRNISRLSTFGICAYIFGKRNQDRLRGPIKNAGLFMIFSYVLRIVSSAILVFFMYDTRYLFGMDLMENNLWVVRVILENISLTFYVVGVGFFIFHGRFNNDKYMTLGILILIIGSIIGIILNWILPIILV